MRVSSAWTPKEISIACNMWAKGEPSLEIAATVGKTKNQVIGKMRRAGIQWGSGNEKPKIDHPPEPKVILKVSFSSFSIKQIIQSFENKTTLLTLKHNQCAQTMDRRIPATCCGKPVTRGSYCDEHARINHKGISFEEHVREGNPKPFTFGRGVNN